MSLVSFYQTLFCGHRLTEALTENTTTSRSRRMPRKRIIVTPKEETDRLPAWATEYVYMVQELESRNILTEFSRRFKVQRRDGYSSVDILLFLLAYFCSGQKIGLRPFSRLCSEYGSRMAAVGGRRYWPGSASISRFLSSLRDEDIDELEIWILNEAVNAEQLEQHSSIVYRDTQGDEWHVFDFDPTITTLRSRALPVGEDLPEPRRLASNMASPGYPGRKRGDVQFSRATLQHSGSGLWTGISMSPGNGKHRQDIERAIHQVFSWCVRNRVASSRGIIRMDGGAGGNVPAMTACMEVGVHYVTRLSRYELLEQPPIKTRLQETNWCAVEDSLSGPKRQAAELGTIRLNAGKRVKKDNGESYEDIDVRVIITRIPIAKDTKKRGAGTVRDGWMYELFCTSLSASAWPAPEIVSLYYGRVGQENRFSQEDQELGLDRIFSYHLPGQRFANLIGLFVWNLRIARGADLVAPLPKKLPLQETRCHITIAPENPPQEPKSSENKQVPMPDAETCFDETCFPQEENVDKSEESAPLENNGPTAAQMFQYDFGPFSNVNWEKQLAHLKGWRWDNTEGLLCPNNTPLRLHGIIPDTNGTLFIRWRSRVTACRSCTMRMQCTTSTSCHFRRDVCFTIKGEEAQEIATVFEQRKTMASKNKSMPIPRLTSAIPIWKPTPDEDNPGDLRITGPLLIPSELRHGFRRACCDSYVDIRLEDKSKQQQRKHVYLAQSPEQRQQRRKTWTWRISQNRLPDTTKVDIELHGGEKLARLLNLKTEEHNAA